MGILKIRLVDMQEDMELLNSYWLLDMEDTQGLLHPEVDMDY